MKSLNSLIDPQTLFTSKLICTENHVNVLDLTNTLEIKSDIPVDFFNTLNKFLKKHNVRKLCLNQNTLTGPLLEKLGLCLKGTAIRALELEYTGLNNVAHEKLNTFLQCLLDTQIKYLELSMNKLTDFHLKTIMDGLKGSPVTHLGLSKLNNIRPKPFVTHKEAPTLKTLEPKTFFNWPLDEMKMFEKKANLFYLSGLSIINEKLKDTNIVSLRCRFFRIYPQHKPYQDSLKNELFENYKRKVLVPYLTIKRASQPEVIEKGFTLQNKKISQLTSYSQQNEYATGILSQLPVELITKIAQYFMTSKLVEKALTYPTIPMVIKEPVVNPIVDPNKVQQEIQGTSSQETQSVPEINEYAYDFDDFQEYGTLDDFEEWSDDSESSEDENDSNSTPNFKDTLKVDAKKMTRK